MREVNEKAYTSQTVSIGPLHRGKPELIGREDYKMICLKSFLDRSAMTVHSCFKLIRGWEERVRGCYAETIGLSSDEFVKMVLVDSGLIIESMLRYWFNETRYGVDEFVRPDLILLENQLPFWVLDGLFHLAFTHYPIKNYHLPSFLEVSVAYLKHECLIQDPPEGISSSGVKHLVDLMRLIQLPPSKSKSTPKYDMEYIRVKTATELQEAGMKFKSCRSSSSKSFLEMTYHSKGVLEIPRFHLTDASESMLRNLIALEVLLYQSNSYISDCLVFMDALIDTPKDVDILVHSGVMDHFVANSEAVAHMFNSLLINTPVNTSNYHFCPLSRRLNAYCKVRRHKWKATLRRDYFNSPIKVASIVAATTLLVLTLIQTVCSVVSLNR